MFPTDFRRIILSEFKNNYFLKIRRKLIRFSYPYIYHHLNIFPTLISLITIFHYHNSSPNPISPSPSSKAATTTVEVHHRRSPPTSKATTVEGHHHLRRRPPPPTPLKYIYLFRNINYVYLKYMSVCILLLLLLLDQLLVKNKSLC